MLLAPGVVVPTEWFQLEWPAEWLNVNIAAKEMVPITVAAALWERSWRGHHILFRSDNEPVVWSINKNTAKDPSLFHVLRCFFFLAATFAFTYKGVHILGKVNDAAYALSRNRPHQFLSFPSQADPKATPVPGALHFLPQGQERTWTSEAWRQRFRDTLYEVIQGQPEGHMTQPNASTSSFATCLHLTPAPQRGNNMFLRYVAC